ncbi:MAG TPA: hypothetical protein VGK19_10275 [Capsulimonadaceae bacterium]|jgi:hypothetical protein
MTPEFDPGALYGGRERPGDTLIDVVDTAEQTVVSIPPRKLNIALRILLALNICSIAFIVVVGFIYLVFHIALLTGLPDPRTVFTSHAAEFRWYAEVSLGWLIVTAIVVAILGAVWIPQISTEGMVLDGNGIAWWRRGWWRRERLEAKWSDLGDIVLLGNLQEIVPNRLTIQLTSGKEQTIAESTSNREREWLEYIVREAMKRHRQRVS